MRELEEDGLLSREEPLRGKIGQPSIPMALNPDGAYFLGLKIGRRSAELVLIDFLGKVRACATCPTAIRRRRDRRVRQRRALPAMRAGLTAAQDKRIAGLGIAMPFELWNWADTVGAPRDVMEAWRNRDIRAEIQDECSFPVYLQNDATSACGAELVFGQTGALRDFIYFYIGAFAGGGVVLNGSLYGGPTGNAGALGSMPVPGPDGQADPADRHRLDRGAGEGAASRKGARASHLWTSPEDWGELGGELTTGSTRAGRALAYGIVSASSVIDFEAAIIDGWMPASVRRALSLPTHVDRQDRCRRTEYSLDARRNGRYSRSRARRRQPSAVRTVSARRRRADGKGP